MFLICTLFLFSLYTNFEMFLCTTTDKLYYVTSRMIIIIKLNEIQGILSSLYMNLYSSKLSSFLENSRTLLTNSGYSFLSSIRSDSQLHHLLQIKYVTDVLEPQDVWHTKQPSGEGGIV